MEVMQIIIDESIASNSIYILTPIGPDDDLYPEVDNWLENGSQTDEITL